MPSSHVQNWHPAQYAANARFVSDLGMPVLELLSSKPGERILDLGCGDGVLTRKIVESGCAVVGIDASPDMVAAARLQGLDAQVMDAHTMSFRNEFDAVFSNAALHWIQQPDRVIAGVWEALKGGGRFVGEFGGYGNVNAIVNALESALLSRNLEAINPWYFPRPEEYGALLTAKGFVVTSLALIPRPTPLPNGMRAWLETFAQPYVSALPIDQRPEFISEVTDALAPMLRDANGDWHADYVRLRFSAMKP
ncbi:MAG: class I SAM-dependent methyltransferase [Nitrospira sp.]|jgi:trans-aconitate methyltransferase|nr:class I SAM-dependent methyltransferase [Nitrospira sp. BO4]